MVKYLRKIFWMLIYDIVKILKVKITNKIREKFKRTLYELINQEIGLIIILFFLEKIELRPILNEVSYSLSIRFNYK